MSRRKQSNPKPIKHDGEDEDCTPSDNKVNADDHFSDDQMHDKLTNERSSNNSSQSNSLHNDRFEKENGDEPFVDSDNSSDGDDGGRNLCKKERYITSLIARDDNVAAESTATTNIMKSGNTEPCEKHRDALGESVDITHLNHSNHCTPTRVQIKTELTHSPEPHDKNDSVEGILAGTESSSPAVSLPVKLSHKSKSKNRSKSRCKSGGAVSSPEVVNGAGASREAAERALVHQLQLPSDVLYLQQREITIHGTPSLGWVVCCAIPLPQGSSLGPFQGQLVSPEAVKVGDLIVQLTNKKGQQALMNVAGQSGGWLALLRSAATPSDRNTHVYWEGGRIWCEVVADIDIGTELRATFSFQADDDEDEEEEEDDEHGSQLDVVNPHPTTTTTTPGSSSGSAGGEARCFKDGQGSDGLHQQVAHSYQQATAAPGHAALIYGCPFCGVRFSSPRTLQGHLSFYCSKKTSDQMVTPTSKERDKGSNQMKSAAEGISVKLETGAHLEKDTPAQRPPASGHRPESPPAPQPPSSTGQPAAPSFKCKHCSYKAHKLSSLNRHMRMHAADKSRAVSLAAEEWALGAARANPDPALNTARSHNSDTFCQECRIQFSSLHTYECHKQHYCAQRRKRALANPSAFAAMFHSPFSFHDAAVATAGIIPSALQMAALNQGGLILPSSSREMNGAVPLLLSGPILSTAGLGNLSISVPTMFLPPMSAQNVQAAAVSPRVKCSPEKHVPYSTSTSSNHTSPHPMSLPHFLALSSTSPTMYHRSLKDLQRAAEFPPNSKSVPDDDHPLDLTMARKETNTAPELANKSNGIIHPLDQTRPMKNSPSSLSQSPKTPDMSLHTQDLSQGSSNSPPTSPASAGTPHRDSTQPSRDFTRPHPEAIRSERSAPNPILMPLLGHPSILVPTSGFLPLPLNLSPPSATSATNANSISKCMDCNIVFYKHGNYLIHKQHYCSGKKRLHPPPALNADTSLCAISDSELKTHSDTLPSLPSHLQPSLSSHLKPTVVKLKKDDGTRVEPHSDSTRPITPITTTPATTSSITTISSHSQEVKYKFYCVPCRIKFSNSSILEAHKEYYCPAGKDSEQTVIVLTSTNSSSQNQHPLPPSSPKDDPDFSKHDSPSDEFTCTRCSSVFVSARLLRLHVCDGGFPCPHCDHVSITENRLAEHLKVHAPTKAYRCTICGYRGNTARGMRMHGKTHIDEGVDFTEENMLVYHEPALVPVAQSLFPGATTDTELLRFKNEPYKRRRSRKAYEKCDYPMPKTDIAQSCLLCGQKCSNAEVLAGHLKVHEIAASQYLSYASMSTSSGQRFLCDSGERSCKRPRLSFSEDDSLSADRESPKRSQPLSQTDPISEHEDSDFLEQDRCVSIEESKHYPGLHGDTELSVQKLEKRETERSESLLSVKTEVLEESQTDSKLCHFLHTPTQSPQRYGSPKQGPMDSPYSPDANLENHNSLPGLNDDVFQKETIRANIKTRRRKSSDLEPGEVAETCMKQEFESDKAETHMDLEDEVLPVRKFDPDQAAADRERIKRSPQGSPLVLTSPNHRLDSSEPRINAVTKRQICSPTPNFLISYPSSSYNSPDIGPPTTTTATVNGVRFTSSSTSSSSSSSSRPSLDRQASSSCLALMTSSSTVSPSPALSFSGALPTSQITLPYLFLPPMQAGTSVSLLRSPSVGSEDRGPGACYCQNCDISFSKQTTYLAHKKYYCTGRPRGEVHSSAKA